MSTLIGAFLGIVIGFVMIWDVLSDGTITTNVTELGTFMLCIGGYIAGGGINKAIFDRVERKQKLEEMAKPKKEEPTPPEEEGDVDVEDEEESARPKKRKYNREDYDAIGL